MDSANSAVDSARFERICVRFLIFGLGFSVASSFVVDAFVLVFGLSGLSSSLASSIVDNGGSILYWVGISKSDVV